VVGGPGFDASPMRSPPCMWVGRAVCAGGGWWCWCVGERAGALGLGLWGGL
jgi:hypothetical protein